MGRLPRTLTLALTLTLTLTRALTLNLTLPLPSTLTLTTAPTPTLSLTRWIGFLGDQTLYTHLASSRGPRQGGLVYTLPCEWNRQVHVRGWVEGES